MAKLIKVTFEDVWYMSDRRFNTAELRDMMGGGYITKAKGRKVAVMKENQSGAYNYKASRLLGMDVYGDVLICNIQQIIN